MVEVTNLAVLAHNIHVNEATKFAPFYLIFGRNYKFGIPLIMDKTIIKDPLQYSIESKEMLDKAKHYLCCICTDKKQVVCRITLYQKTF